VYGGQALFPGLAVRREVVTLAFPITKKRMLGNAKSIEGGHSCRKVLLISEDEFRSVSHLTCNFLISLLIAMCHLLAALVPHMDHQNTARTMICAAISGKVEYPPIT
jgi:hypothetical protein